MIACACCGGSISPKNSYGYCSRTPECRSRYQAAWQDARRPPTTRPMQPCKSCGVPTTSASGYCKRTKTCDAARSRAIYTPEKSFAKYKPEESRRRCFGCDGYIDLRVHESIAFCSKCQGSKETHRKRWRKAETMAAYGGACACCGENNLAFLTIDHVNGDGAAERKAIGGTNRGNGGSAFYAFLKTRGWPEKDRYQVLCFNCNAAKGTKPACPCSQQKYTAFDIIRPGQLTLF
jgi:hypothetical protein